MQSLTVRAATTTDVPRLAQLWYEKTVLQQQADPRIRIAPDGQARWTAAAEAWVGDPLMALFVAGAGDEVVGYIVARVESPSPGLLPDRIGTVSDVAIDAHRYHAGVGRSLVAAVRGWLLEQGVHQLSIKISRRHAVEQAFWRALGAKEWFDCLWMKF
jgi:GNAT superfamily N-acetyltransferase